MKVIKLLLLIVLATTQFAVFAQKEAYYWYFGRKAGLDFNTTPPTTLSNSPNTGNADTDEAHATIADADGNLLFYTNGETIWNKNLTAMPNANDALNGDWSTTQCATVFPVPGSTTDYYVITTPFTGTATELLWSRVDMTADGGLGDIKAPVASNRNQAMPSCPSYMMESVASVPHINGTDIWVIAHTADDPSTGGNEGGTFVVWLVTSTGIAYNNSYPIGYAYPQLSGFSKGIGIMKANSCFNRIFISYYNNSSRVEGFQFSNTTGAISNWPSFGGPLVIDQYRNSGGTMAAIGSFAYGLEISPNGRYLYCTMSGEGGGAAPRELQQYDLQAANNAAVNASAVRLTPAAPDGDRYGQLQLGPDGKIYHTLFFWNNGTCKIAVINSPNTGGTGANYVESQYVWSGTGLGSSMGLTSFHKGFISGRAAITSSVNNLEEVCLGDVLDLTAQSAGNIVSYQWNIDKNLNASTDYTTGPTINHTYTSTGDYTVELRVTDACGYDYTSESLVKVIPKVNSAGTVSCSPLRGNVTSPNGAYTYVWYSDPAATNAIATGTTNVTLPGMGTSGTVYLKAMTSASASSFTLSNGPAATPNDNPAASPTFDFSVNEATLTLTDFQWKAGNCTYSASDVFQNATITITNTGTSAVVYSRVQSVKVSDMNNSAGASYIENVNTILPVGNYQISITGISTGVRYRANWNGCGANTVDAQGALTYNTNASTQCVATDFHYSLNKINTTGLGCSIPATINFNCAMPVTWLSFTGERTSEGNLLQWSTASETNASHFLVERSYDGVNFTLVNSVEATGNSRSISSYSLVDAFDYNGVLYYRLKQVDIDGQYEYSNTISVAAQSSQYILLPNPGDGLVYLNGGNNGEEVQVDVWNVIGVHVRTIGKVVSGSSIDLRGLPIGVYMIQVTDKSGITYLRYVLK